MTSYRSSSVRHAFRSLRHLGDSNLLRQIASAAAEFDFRRATDLESVPVEALVHDRTHVRLRLEPVVFGQTPVVDLVALSLLVAQADPKVVFEFGTFTGTGTVHLALNAPQAIVHTLDLSPEDRRANSELAWESGIDDNTIGSHLGDLKRSGRVVQHYADSRRFDTDPFLDRIDFTFIDAAHSYESVLNDTRKTLEMSHSGSTVVWHDYSRACPGVVRALTVVEPDFVDMRAVLGTSLAVGVVR